jgi:hypothetical protein
MTVVMKQIPVLRLRDDASNIECDIVVVSFGDFSHPHKVRRTSFIIMFVIHC